MTDELFDELSHEFPGKHGKKLWRYAFYFTDEETFNAFKGTCLLLNLKPTNMGDIGPNMLDRYFVIFERKSYDPFN